MKPDRRTILKRPLRLKPLTMFAAGLAAGISTSTALPLLAPTVLAVSVTWVTSEIAESVWERHGKHLNGAALGHLSAIVGRAFRRSILG